MERKLTKVVDGTEITMSGRMCSYSTDVVNHLCSSENADTCRECGMPTKGRYVKLSFFRSQKGILIMKF